jgi:hypothetical protein
MNQTQHQRWSYRSAGLQALIEEPTSTAQYHARVATLRQQRGAKSWENDQQLCTRGTILFSWKQYCLMHTRKEIVFHRRQFFLYQLHSIISEKRLLRNTFAIEGVFLAKSQYP